MSTPSASSTAWRRGQLSGDDFSLLVQASQELERTPIYIGDTPAIPISTLPALGG
jgi:replicative DNA helicase